MPFLKVWPATTKRWPIFAFTSSSGKTSLRQAGHRGGELHLLRAEPLGQVDAELCAIGQAQPARVLLVERQPALSSRE